MKPDAAPDPITEALYTDAEEKANRFANFLLTRNVKKGDKETETDIILRREVQKQGGRR